MSNSDNLINHQDYNHITTTMTSKDRVSTPIDTDEIIGIKVLQVN